VASQVAGSVASSLDDRVTEILKEARLVRPDNAFFELADNKQQVELRPALEIALGWQRITRTFMFTTLQSLGVLAKQFTDSEVDPPRTVLGAFQTAHQVIGDDLANAADEFAVVAPKGPNGIHYVWWNDSIVAPLLERANGSGDAAAKAEAPGIDALIANMRRLGDSPLGAAVELRVVEAIALDIALAFRKVYGFVKVGDEWVYRAPHALDWIDSHIKAETSHASSVSDDEVGMTMMVMPEDEDEFIELAREYAASWARGLDEFAASLRA
jgi:hypothetical protein